MSHSSRTPLMELTRMSGLIELHRERTSEIESERENE